MKIALIGILVFVGIALSLWILGFFLRSLASFFGALGNVGEAPPKEGEYDDEQIEVIIDNTGISTIVDVWRDKKRDAVVTLYEDGKFKTVAKDGIEVRGEYQLERLSDEEILKETPPHKRKNPKIVASRLSGCDYPPKYKITFSPPRFSLDEESSRETFLIWVERKIGRLVLASGYTRQYYERVGENREVKPKIANQTLKTPADVDVKQAIEAGKYACLTCHYAIDLEEGEEVPLCCGNLMEFLV